MTAFLLSIALALAAGAAQQDMARPTGHPPMDAAPVSGDVELPDDAQRVVERKAGCTHLARGMTGDGSAGDLDTEASMDRLDCGAVERDAAAMERKYPNDRTLRELLRAAARN